MIVKDKKNKVNVDVSDRGCINRPCYWPRPDPGVFTQGQGYRQRSITRKEWLCGNREIRGCPMPKPEPKEESVGGFMNKSQRLISLVEKSKYVQRLPRDFTIFLELNAPDDYEGTDDYAEVALAVEAEYERPDVSAGWQGGWTINSVEIAKDFKFMGTLYKAGAVFPIGLIEHAPKFFKIDDMGQRKKSFEDWVSSEVEELAGKRKGGM